jgi:hypothetical protein
MKNQEFYRLRNKLKRVISSLILIILLTGLEASSLGYDSQKKSKLDRNYSPGILTGLPALLQGSDPVIAKGHQPRDSHEKWLRSPMGNDKRIAGYLTGRRNTPHPLPKDTNITVSWWTSGYLRCRDKSSVLTPIPMRLSAKQHRLVYRPQTEDRLLKEKAIKALEGKIHETATDSGKGPLDSCSGKSPLDSC